MGKGFGILAGFVVAVAAVVAAGVMWVGPQLLNLAMFDSRRGEPYTLLDFARGQSAEAYRARYRQPLAGLVASEGGELLAGYRLSHLLEGRAADEWAYVSQLRMARALDLVQVMTSAPYRLMRDNVPGLESVQLGSHAPEQTLWRAALAIWLVEVREDSARNPLEPVIALLGLGDGRLVWDTAAASLVEGLPWNHVVVVDFATDVEAFAWLRHADVAAARAVANARAQQMALAVYLREPD